MRSPSDVALDRAAYLTPPGGRGPLARIGLLPGAPQTAESLTHDRWIPSLVQAARRGPDAEAVRRMAVAMGVVPDATGYVVDLPCGCRWLRPRGLSSFACLIHGDP